MLSVLAILDLAEAAASSLSILYHSWSGPGCSTYMMLGYMKNMVILVDELRYSAIRRYVIYDTFQGFFVPLNTFSSELLSYYAFFLFFPRSAVYIFSTSY